MNYNREADFVPPCSHNLSFYDAFLQATVTAIDWKL